MKKLTKAEEEIMQIIWEIAPCTVSDIRNYMVEEMGLEKPPHSTVSTMVRILDDKKDFLKHTAYGRTFVYEPKVTKDEYSRQSVRTLVQDYFGGSMNRLVSFLVQEEDLSLRDLNDLMGKLEEE
jgi:predicted transcriptional regulator